MTGLCLTSDKHPVPVPPAPVQSGGHTGNAVLSAGHADGYVQSNVRADHAGGDPASVASFRMHETVSLQCTERSGQVRSGTTGKLGQLGQRFRLFLRNQLQERTIPTREQRARILIITGPEGAATASHAAGAGR